MLLQWSDDLLELPKLTSTSASSVVPGAVLSRSSSRGLLMLLSAMNTGAAVPVDEPDSAWGSLLLGGALERRCHGCR